MDHVSDAEELFAQAKQLQEMAAKKLDEAFEGKVVLFNISSVQKKPSVGHYRGAHEGTGYYSERVSIKMANGKSVWVHYSQICGTQA